MYLNKNPLHYNKMTLCILDFETTGLVPTSDEIIECAMKIYDKEYVYSTLVKPDHVGKAPPGYHGAYIFPKITELTGITNRMIYKQGITQKLLAQQIYEFLETHKVTHIVAHNGDQFDFILLKLLLLRFGYNFTKYQYIDTMYLFKIILRKTKTRCTSMSQENLCSMFQVVQKDAHRALGDVVALESLWYHIVTLYSLRTKQYLNYNYDVLKKLGSPSIEYSDRIVYYISHLLEMYHEKRPVLTIRNVNGRTRSLLYNFLDKQKIKFHHETGSNYVTFRQ